MDYEQEEIQPIPEPGPPSPPPAYSLYEYDPATGMASFTRNWSSKVGEEVAIANDALQRRAMAVINAALLASAGCAGVLFLYLFARTIALVGALIIMAYAFFVGIAGAIVEMNQYRPPAQEAGPVILEPGGTYHDGEDVIEEAVQARLSAMDKESGDRAARVAAYLERKGKQPRSGRDKIELEIEK